jgi:uncharacterized membrane protein
MLRPVPQGMVLLSSVLVLGAAMIFVPELASGLAVLAITGFCHSAAYLGLLCWFAGSLQPGREPVVTLLARRIRTSMPNKVVHYTRQVTFAWCVFFAAQIATSAALLLLTPLSFWSTFVTMLNLPLLMTMTAGEFGFRSWLFRHETRTSLLGTLAAMRNIRSIGNNRSSDRRL